MKDVTIKSRSTLSELPKTIHGGQAWKLKEIEDYSHNLNPFGPPECIGELMVQAAAGVDHYPDDSCSELKNTIAKQFGLGTENVTIGAGSSDIIRNFPNTFFNVGDKVMLNRPSFAEYAQQCRIVGAEILWNELKEEDDFYIDPESVTSFIDKGIKALYICNPNNPTGRVESKNKIEKIVKECSDSGVLVFLDETLLELVHGYSEKTCCKLVKKYGNLVVAGSLTKSFAIPGIRIGFGFASEEIISEMEKVRMTWNVGQAEQVVANELIGKHMGYVHEAAKMMAEESVRMNGCLNDLGFPAGRVADSFFYFNSLKPLGIKCPVFKELMLEDKIMVRDCSSFGDNFQWYVRYSVKDRERNDAFISAVENSLKKLRE